MDAVKTILITGTTGFLGSHIAHRLVNKYKVISLKRHLSNTWRIKDILDRMIHYDVDKTDLKAIFENHSIHTIIHTATNYGRSNDSLTDIIKTNLLFPMKLIELAMEYNVSNFFNTDTVANRSLNPYSLSKKQFCDWFKYITKRIRVVNIKLEHFYGPKDDDSKFVMFLINKMKKNEPLDLTQGEQIRDFIYIDDVVNAYETLLNNVSFLNELYDEFEIGTGIPIRIKDLVLLIKKYTRTSSMINFGVIPYRDNEIMESKSDISKILAMNWQPKVSLDQGINYTISK